jgi:toxin YoeB
MNKMWHDSAWEDYLYWQTQDKRTLKKINRLIQDIERNGYKGIGKPEPLKGNFAGWWSVKIDEKNRIVFKIEGRDDNQTLTISQCGSHYRDN